MSTLTYNCVSNVDVLSGNVNFVDHLVEPVALTLVKLYHGR